MKTLGFSIFPEFLGVQKTINYIKEVNKDKNFEWVFMSLLSTKEFKDFQELELIFATCKEQNLKLVVDVSENTFKNLNIKLDDANFWTSRGIFGLRIDTEIDTKYIINFIKNRIHIQFNASTNKEYVENIIKNNRIDLNFISVCHNFYPLQYSGLSFEKFIKNSLFFKNMNIQVGAFITHDIYSENIINSKNKHHPVPTIEKHRNVSIINQLYEMLSFDFIDMIIISSHYIKDFPIEKIQDALINYKSIIDSKIIDLEAELIPNISKMEKEIIECYDIVNLANASIYKDHFKINDNYHINRLDNSDYFIRSSAPRVLYDVKTINPDPQRSINKFNLGDIVVLNKNSNYAGECHIVLKQIEVDEKTHNLVGRIVPNSLWKLYYVNGGRKWKIITKQK